MFIKYKGGRSRYDISLNRKTYSFTPENNRTLEIRDQALINRIFRLINNAEFEVVERESVEGQKIEESVKEELKVKKPVKKESKEKSKGGKK